MTNERKVHIYGVESLLGMEGKFTVAETESAVNFVGLNPAALYSQGAWISHRDMARIIAGDEATLSRTEVDPLTDEFARARENYRNTPANEQLFLGEVKLSGGKYCLDSDGRLTLFGESHELGPTTSRTLEELAKALLGFKNSSGVKITSVEYDPFKR
jgi:hypothetical protein